MLTRISIKNYRCLSDFTIEPESFQLWMGDNGSGKSSVFEVLRAVQLLLRGGHVADLFQLSDSTCWKEERGQTFHLILELGDDIYSYKLDVDYDFEDGSAEILAEYLELNNTRLIDFFDGSIRFCLENEKGEKTEKSILADPHRSVIPILQMHKDAAPLQILVKAVESWLIVQPLPVLMEQDALKEKRILSPHGENIAEWFRYVLQEEPNLANRAREQLKEVLPGFDQIKMREVGEARRLTAVFRIQGKDHHFDFKDLSDGQRQLIFLYTVLEALRAGVFTTLFIDEPENFVSLREIEPWLGNVEELCEEMDRQIIISSHHPEIINAMARGKELLFSRPEGGPAVAQPMPAHRDTLTPAEIVARGWENG